MSTSAFIPEAYRAGHARTRQHAPEWADRYVRHTQLGDPLADALVAWSRTDPQGQQWIQRGMDGGMAALGDAPPEVKAFFSEAEAVPDWWRPDEALAGCRGFHRHAEMLVAAFVGAVLIEGFSTLISKSFSITGRVMDNGVRRLKQNNRHLVEIFMPDGLQRQGDGWKLSVRIRLVHARVRALLSASPEWAHSAWGVPLSSAHIGYATAAFSGLLLKRAESLGVRLSPEERDSFMLIWRYSGHLMGVHPELQCVTAEEALALQAVGVGCEPPPGLESIQMAHCLINAAPIVSGITDVRAHRKLVAKVFRVSRALIGDEMADQLNYPPQSGVWALAALRTGHRLDQWLQAALPALARRRKASQFQLMLQLSHFDAGRIGYGLPQVLHAENDPPS